MNGLEPLRVAFTGGGTGGHIYPALAIDRAIRAWSASRAQAYEARFFGNAGGLERDLVPPEIPLAYVPSRPLSRKLSPEIVRTAVTNGLGVGIALAALARFAPDLVIATGGYVCAPVVAAARLWRTATRRRCPIAFVEINAHAGLTTRLLAPLVDEVWGAFSASQASFGEKFVLTGAPVRPELLVERSPQEARRSLGLDPASTTIVVMGGSQGARSVNEAVAALVTRRSLPAAWQLLHVSGHRDHAYMQAEERVLAAGNRVTLLPYLNDPSAAYAAADIVICRAGASTLAELAATGTPALLIPYPFAADDHQMRNAEIFAQTGAARILRDADASGDALWWTLREMLEPQTLAGLRAGVRSLAPADAAARVLARVAHLLETAGKAGPRSEHSHP